MQNITFDVKVNGTVTAKALKTGADGIATYKVGKFAKAPTVEVQENWTNERFEPKSTGYYGVNVYEKEADAKTHAKDSKHTWTNEQNEYYASIKKDGNKGITSKGFAGAYYGLYDTNVKANMTDDHLIAVFEMDKDGYACNLYGPTTSTVAGHTCKARLNYTDDAGWKVSRTVNGHTQYFICMGKDDLTDKKMLTNTKFAYKELVAPDGYLPTEDPIPATITKLLSVPTTLTSTQIVNMIDEDWENNPTYIYLEKRSANSKCTDGNPNYSLKGATYKVFKTNADATAAVSSRDFSKAIATLTVDESGNSQVLEMTDYMTRNSATGKIETTKFYIVESVTGKNYQMDKTVHPITVTAKNDKNNPATLKVTDVPVDDPIEIRVLKQTVNGNGTVDEALGDEALTVEEIKGDVLGLFLNLKLIADGQMDPLMSREDAITTFVVANIRSSRFGEAAALGLSNIIIYNWMKEKQAFSIDRSGHYLVDFDKAEQAVRELATRILTIQATGDKAAASALIRDYGTTAESLLLDFAALQRAHIPMDIRFQFGW